SFGKSFGCLDDPEKEVEFATSFDRLNEQTSRRLSNMFWKVAEKLNGKAKEVEHDKEVVSSFAYNIIRERREKGFQGKQKDLLELFMNAKDEEGKPLTDEMLKDSLLNFVIAGRDTTAQALTWM